MGLGGCLGIINATPFTWTQTSIESYQFLTWSFPKTIKPGEVVKQYIEWDTALFVTESDTVGKVSYGLDNPSSTSFEFVAGRPEPEHYRILVTPTNFDHAGGMHDNSQMELEFIHDECVPFYLSGEQGSLYTNAPVDWMHSTLDVIGNKTLKEITIAGSHDSGMGPDIEYSLFASEMNTRTQEVAVGGQLIFGARWFDIRPVIGDGGKWFTGHESGGSNSQGGKGQLISEIIAQINTFLSAHSELVILELSHDYQTDDNYRDLNQDEWNALFSMLTEGLEHLYIKSVDDLSTVKINEFIGKGPAVLVVARTESNINVGDFSTKGIHPGASFPVYNSYADSSNPDKVISDQLDKMKSANHSKEVFLLSWTETEEGIDNAFGKGIKANALEINQKLFGNVAPVLAKNDYPNIIMEDYIMNNEMAEMAMAINWLNTNLW